MKLLLARGAHCSSARIRAETPACSERKSPPRVDLGDRGAALRDVARTRPNDAVAALPATYSQKLLASAPWTRILHNSPYGVVGAPLRLSSIIIK